MGKFAASGIVLAMLLAGAAAGQDVVGVAPDKVLFPVKPYDVPDRGPATQKALEQFNRERFGMFIHWGIYSEAGGVIRGKRVYGLSEWLMHNSKTPSAEYLQLAKTFDPVDFDAHRWVAMMKAAGIRYFVITAKHHEGFAMFKSAASPHNIVDGTRFARDPLKELADAAHAAGIGVGFYYSQYQDWTERNGGGNTWEFDPQKADFDEYFRRKVIPQVTELLTNYGPVQEIWFDTPGPMPATYSQQLRDLVRRLQPDCLLNSRIGNGLGDYTSPDDSEVPPEKIARGNWEAISTHNHSWGYSRFDNDFKSTGQLIRLLVLSASRGGNFMLNEGPDGRGDFPEAGERRLLGVGDWLKRNGASVYDTTRSPLPQMPWGVATQHGTRLYLHVFDRPKDGVLTIPGLAERVTAVRLLDGGKALPFSQKDGLSITLPTTGAAGDDVVVTVDTATPVANRRDQGIVLSPDYGRTTLDLADATFSPGVTLQSAKVQLAVPDIRKFYTVTGLTDPSRNVAWTVQVARPGDYHIDLEYSATDAQAKREGVVEMGGQQRTFEVAPVGNLARDKIAPLAYKPVGILSFEKPGTYVIRVRPDTAGGELFALRTMYLTPVD